MPEISIRTAIATDIPRLMALNHNYSSDHVWQMELHRQEEKIGIAFREVRLPRSVQVKYPRTPQMLADEWTHRSVMLVALIEENPVGYIGMVQNMTPLSTWVTDLAVSMPLRRQGIGTALVLAGQKWAGDRYSRRLVLEMQPKNYPGIRMAQKLGYDFSGYSDRYYANHDIALFFSKWLR